MFLEDSLSAPLLITFWFSQDLGKGKASMRKVNKVCMYVKDCDWPPHNGNYSARF